jgi:hypothetical protein
MDKLNIRIVNEKQRQRQSVRHGKMDIGTSRNKEELVKHST